MLGGLSIEETTQAVNVSPATTKREWATALWFHHAAGNGARFGSAGRISDSITNQLPER
jgi:hypothetical protein